MKPFHSLILPLALGLVSVTFTACGQSQQRTTAPTSGRPAHGPPGKPDPKFAAAFEACRQSLGGKDERPDHARMEACLTAKGFPKPKGPAGGPPPGDGPGAPPPPDYDFDEDLDGEEDGLMIAQPALQAAEPAPFDAGQAVYLHSYLLPFRPWLDDPSVTEILVNRAGEVWIERIGQMAMQREPVPGVDEVLLQRLATQVARISHQSISREQPLLGATLPGGERIQIVAPPATRGGTALAIRRHVAADLRLDDYRVALAPVSIGAGTAPTLNGLRHAVAARRTVLISGGTSSGKTTLLNALLKEIPAHERIVAVEDTPEIQLHHANSLGLVAVKDEQGEARVATDELLRAALRLRPDRIVLGELRGTEAVTFLRAINTGHPGSFTTIHANTAQGALEQLALLVMQAGIGLGRRDALAYIHGLVDVVVQVSRVGGERRIVDIVDVARLPRQ